MNSKNPAYPLLCAAVLDAFFQARGSIAAASGQLGLTTGRLSRLLGRDKDLLAAANRLRQHYGLKPMRG